MVLYLNFYMFILFFGKKVNAYRQLFDSYRKSRIAKSQTTAFLVSPTELLPECQQHLYRRALALTHWEALQPHGPSNVHVSTSFQYSTLKKGTLILKILLEDVTGLQHAQTTLNTLRNDKNPRNTLIFPDYQQNIQVWQLPVQPLKSVSFVSVDTPCLQKAEGDFFTYEDRKPVLMSLLAERGLLSNTFELESPSW